MRQNRFLSLATLAMVLLPGFGTTAVSGVARADRRPTKRHGEAAGLMSVPSPEGRAAMAAQRKQARVPAVPKAWTSATPMPLSDAVTVYAHAQCDNQPNSFYVIEGANQQIAKTTKAWRYDADTDTWNVLAPIPNPPGAIRPAAVCHQGFIYVAGGGGSDGVGLNRFFIYDVANDTWSAGANIPRNVGGAAMGAFGGQVYVIGGDDDVFFGAGTSNEVDIYDIASDTWTTTGAPMPTAALLAGWRQIGQYVYVVGGFTDAFPANSNVTQRYDMSANTWATGPTFTSARAWLALAATSQFLYAIGGDTDGGGFGDATALVERLDHTTFPAGAWTDTADPLPGPLNRVAAGFCTSAVAGGEVWALNGLFQGVFQSINQYRPSEPCPPGGPPAPVVVKTGATLTVEGCGPANGAIDPGEVVTVNFALRNIGTADTINVVATLQASGGVTPITTSQTYGVLTAGGPAVSRPFTFAAAGACGGTLTASLAVQDGATNLGTKTFNFTLGTSSTTSTATFSNPAPITINDLAPATPYPSDITVAGLTDSVSKITVTLNGLTHTFPSDIDILLVGPNGQGMVLMSDAGGGTPVTSVTFTLDDEATMSIPTPIVNGTYWPFDGDQVLDLFPASAPPPPPSYYGTELSFFNGIDPNGTWSLYVVDDAGADVGSISGGWSITITTAVPVCCQGGVPQISINDVSVTEGNAGTTTATFTATLSTVSTQTVSVNFATADGTATTANNDYQATSGFVAFPPGTAAQTIPVTVNGDTAFEPNEMFFVNLSNPVNATIGDGQGVGTIINDDGPAGTNFVTELFHGYSELEDLAAVGGVPDLDYYRIAQKPYSSYEVLVDATSGDIGPGVEVQRIEPDGTTVIQSAAPVGIGSSQSLRWANTTASEVTSEFVRVRSVGCTTDCGPDDVYNIHAFETTYSVPRFNNSGTQITVLLLQNPTNYTINGTICFWDTTGALIGTTAGALAPRELLVLNTATVAPGVGGSVTVAHDGRYGDLSGKTVALEPATGFSFDSPMLPRLKVN